MMDDEAREARLKDQGITPNLCERLPAKLLLAFQSFAWNPSLSEI